MKTSESPFHEAHAAALPEYFKLVRQQEKSLVAAGLPARGLAKFTTGWFEAWQERDVAAIVAHATEDVDFVDPGTGGTLHGRDLLADYTERFFVAVPDLVFYPTDGVKMLPYWDFFGGVARVTIPWRAIGRFSGTLALDGWPSIAATGRCMDFVGIDRYVFADGWKIARIDTDYDLLGALQQVGLVPGLNGPVARVGALVERLMAAPVLRLTA
jgi:hypothetical protein